MIEILKNKLKHFLRRDEIESSYIEIFESKYGLGGGDLYVWANKTNIESLPYEYHLSIEGFLFYQTLEDGIRYYNELLEEFETFIVDNIEITNEDIEDTKYLEWGKYKRLYGVDIRNTENGWTIDVEAPVFYSLNNTYLWLKGLVNQLNEILAEYKNE